MSRSYELESNRVAIRVVAAVAACLAACSANFEPPWRVTGLRVLAVRADQPYAPPGATVQLDALAVDPANRPLTWGWGTCVDPSSSEVTDCIDAADWPTFTIAPDMPSHAVTIPDDAITRMPAAAQARAAVGVVVVACPGDLSIVSPPTTIHGTGALPFLCRDHASGRILADDEYEAGVKHIFVRATDQNANPSVGGVSWDGQAWPEGTTQTAKPCNTSDDSLNDCDGVLHHVAATPASGSDESGVDSFGQHFHEQVIVQYYATEGSFSDGVRIGANPETKWSARKQSAGSAVTMWMVVRDDRGGVDWAVRTVNVDQ